MLSKKIYLPLCSILLLSLVFACSPGTHLLNEIPVNSVSVEVTDQDGQPVQGAQVEASNGRKTTTDENGIAKVRFGSVGIHYIGVMADNYLPSNFVVTMPTDNGETVKASLANQMEFNSFAFASANMYPLMFNYLFSSYGYGLELQEYNEGEWTSWVISSDGEDDETLTMSKGFLKKLDNGQEWWQIIVEDEEEGEAYVAEVLFSEDRNSIRRIRQKIGTDEIQEPAVSEGWYSRPAALTEESKNAALVSENIELEIPRGVYKANQFKFDMTTGMFLQLWESSDNSVPGGVLRYEMAADDESIYESTLMDYGSDAVTMLESY